MMWIMASSTVMPKLKKSLQQIPGTLPEISANKTTKNSRYCTEPLNSQVSTKGPEIEVENDLC